MTESGNVARHVMARLLPEYSPKVDLGHILQIVALVVTVGVTIFIFALPAYVQVKADQSKTDAQVVALVSAMAASDAALNLRISTDEHRMDMSDQSLRDWEARQTDAVEKVGEAVAGLKGAIDAMRRR